MIRYDPSNWYWIGQPDGYTSAILYSSAARAIVLPSDAAYVAWQAAGGNPTVWPQDATGALTTAALDEVLTSASPPQPPTGLTPPTQAQLIVYANGKVGALRATPKLYNLGGASVRADASTDTVSLVSGLADWGTALPTATQQWIDDFGAVTTITGAQAVALKTQGLSYIQSLYAMLATVTAAVAGGSITTYAQIDAEEWPT